MKSNLTSTKGKKSLDCLFKIFLPWECIFKQFSSRKVRILSFRPLLLECTKPTFKFTYFFVTKLSSSGKSLKRSWSLILHVVQTSNQSLCLLPVFFLFIGYGRSLVGTLILDLFGTKCRIFFRHAFTAIKVGKILVLPVPSELQRGAAVKQPLDNLKQSDCFERPQSISYIKRIFFHINSKRKTISQTATLHDDIKYG